MKFPTGATNCLALCLAIGAADAQDLSPAQSLPDYKGQRLEIVGDNGPPPPLCRSPRQPGSHP